MILSILNSISVMLCIYVLISKKYKTDDKRVTILFICLNIIFMSSLWIVLDATYSITVIYAAINSIAFLSLVLTMSLVKKSVVRDTRNLKERLAVILKPFKTMYNKILKRLKHN